MGQSGKSFLVEHHHGQLNGSIKKFYHIIKIVLTVEYYKRHGTGYMKLDLQCLVALTGLGMKTSWTRKNIITTRL